MPGINQIKAAQRKAEQKRVDAGFPSEWRWSWNRDWFWKGSNDRTGVRHSRYFRNALSKHGQTKIDKDPFVLQPFVAKVFSDLGVDPMYLAVHCEHQRTSHKQLETYLGSTLAGLCRFRVPGYADQKFQLSTAVVKIWPSPETLPPTSITADMAKREHPRSSVAILSAAEITVVRNVIAKWRNLVPDMSDRELSDWLGRSLLDNKENLLWPLRWDLLLSAIGYRLGWLWIVVSDDSSVRDRYSKTVSRLRNVLSAALTRGEIFPEIHEQRSQKRSTSFATTSADRAALLDAYRAYVNDPSLTDHAVTEQLRMIVDQSDAAAGSKVQRSQTWIEFAQHWDRHMPKMEIQQFKIAVLRFIRSRSIGNTTVMQWDSYSLCLYMRYVIENGMKDPAYLIQLLNNRRLYPSIDAIISLPYDRKFQLSALSYTLKESCPRWWDALGLDSDPYTAWRNCLKRHGGLPEVGKTPADTVEVIMRLRKLDDIEPTLPSSPITTPEELATYVSHNHFPTGFAQWRLLEMASTKAAVQRMAANRLLLELGDTLDSITIGQ